MDLQDNDKKMKHEELKKNMDIDLNIQQLLISYQIIVDVLFLWFNINLAL